MTDIESKNKQVQELLQKLADMDLSAEEIINLSVAVGEKGIQNKYNHLETLREKHRELLLEIANELKPYGMTAEKYLSLAPHKALKLMQEQYRRSKMRGSVLSDKRHLNGLARVPKYQHPDHPERVWGGMGPHPVWVKDYLGQGGDLKDLRVKKDTQWGAD